MSDALEPNSVWSGSVLQRLDIEATYTNDDGMRVLLRDAHRALSVAVRAGDAANAVVEAAGRCAEWFQHPNGCALQMTPTIDPCDCGLDELVHALKVVRALAETSKAGEKTP